MPYGRVSDAENPLGRGSSTALEGLIHLVILGTSLAFAVMP